MAKPPSGDPEQVEALNALIREFVLKHEATREIDPVAYYRALLRVLEDANPVPSVAKAKTLQQLALALAESGDRAAAKDMIEDVVRYFDAILGADAPETREAEAARDLIDGNIA
jgi:hypothetical protein